MLVLKTIVCQLAMFGFLYAFFSSSTPAQKALYLSCAAVIFSAMMSIK